MCNHSQGKNNVKPSKFNIMTNLSKNDSLIQGIEQFEHPALVEKGNKAIFLALDKAIEYCISYSFTSPSSPDDEVKNTISALFTLKEIFR